MSKIYLIDAGTHKPFLIEERATVGRDESCELNWASSSLAPKHLCISHKNDNFFVESLDNKNPVSLNGIKILAGQKYLIKKGDSLEFARRKFVLSATDELPEKTMTKIRDDVFGLSSDSSASFGDLKLDTDYSIHSEEKVPRDEMKKSRRIIVEIQQTKKQLMAKVQVWKTLKSEKAYVEEEIQRVHQQLDKAPVGEQSEFFSQREAELAELKVLEEKITDLKRSLSKLISQRDEKKARLQAESRFMNLFEEEEKLLQRQQEVENELSVLESLALEEKLQKLDECLKAEQENYQSLHDFKALNTSQKKRSG